MVVSKNKSSTVAMKSAPTVQMHCPHCAASIWGEPAQFADIFTCPLCGQADYFVTGATPHPSAVIVKPRHSAEPEFAPAPVIARASAETIAAPTDRLSNKFAKRAIAAAAALLLLAAALLYHNHQMEKTRAAAAALEIGHRTTDRIAEALAAPEIAARVKKLRDLQTVAANNGGLNSGAIARALAAQMAEYDAQLARQAEANAVKIAEITAAETAAREETAQREAMVAAREKELAATLKAREEAAAAVEQRLREREAELQKTQDSLQAQIEALKAENARQNEQINAQLSAVAEKETKVAEREQKNWQAQREAAAEIAKQHEELSKREAAAQPPIIILNEPTPSAPVIIRESYVDPLPFYSSPLFPRNRGGLGLSFNFGGGGFHGGRPPHHISPPRPQPPRPGPRPR